MTAAERSYIGLALQSGKDYPNETDGDFTYVLFRAGGIAPNNIVLPLDQEIGGGAMLRDMVKVGVNSGGALDIIPRPNSLGWFLYGALGEVDTTPFGAGAYEHVFTMPTDQFDAPYFTVRSAPGNMWGEQFQNCRVAGLALNFAAARFVEGAVTFLGGMPERVDQSSWAAQSAADGGPQFLSPVSTIEVPTYTPLSVLGGSVAFGLAIPLDEQYVIGRYDPEDFSINQRSMAITLNVKISDEILYSKMMYDPAGSSLWVADLFREADINLRFESPNEAESGTPYSLTIEAAPSYDNIVWSAAPVGLRAGRQVVMAVTGVCLNATGADSPIRATLVNTQASYA